MKNGNEPAYPVIDKIEDETIGGKEVFTRDGLTKREYFAGVAMQGIMSHHGLPSTWDKTNLSEKIDSVAVASVILADELLKQLEN